MNAEAKETLLKMVPYGMYAIGVRRGEERNAFTANWLVQCSFEPVLVALAVENDGRSISMMRESGVFAVSFYSAAQRRQAGRLARPAARAPEKLQEMEYRDGAATGAPVLTGTLGYLECRIVGEQPSGDHTLFIGEVVEARVLEPGEPLEIHEAGYSYAG